MDNPMKAITKYYQKHNILPPQKIEYMEYAMLSISSELIKILIYWMIFSILGQAERYWFILAVLFSLRWLSGGIHAKTFWGCFISSFIAIATLIFGAPLLPCPSLLLSFILVILGLFSIRNIPYTPAFRPISNVRIIRLLRSFYIILLISWIIVLNVAILPENYVSSGFYTLLFQVGQLHIPKGRRNMT